MLCSERPNGAAAHVGADRNALLHLPIPAFPALFALKFRLILRMLAGLSRADDLQETACEHAHLQPVIAKVPRLRKTALTSRVKMNHP
jgi:hypothetical protein